MNNNLYKRLLENLVIDRENFEILVNADNELGLNVTSDEIINYLEFYKNDLKNVIMGNVIITEGDVLSVLKLINDLISYEGEFTLYINDDNLGTISYLVKIANELYKEFNLNLTITIDYSKNYNKYLNTLVTIYGSKTFISETNCDFPNANKIIV